MRVGRLCLPAVVALAGLLTACENGPAPTCTESSAAPSPPTARSVASATHASAEAPALLNAVKPSSVSVSIANANDERVIAIDAVHGSFDEPFVLIAVAKGESAADGPPAAKKERVAISISNAFFGGDAPIPLHVVDAATGRNVTEIEIAAGEHAYVRITGDGFKRDAVYRAGLTIHGAEPAVYRLRIQSTKPHAPLGLRAAQWTDTFSDVMPFQRRHVTLNLPVDMNDAATAPYHIAVRTPADVPEGARPLPPCGIEAIPAKEAGKIVVKLPPLSAGRYVGVVEIQGEALQVDLTLKNSFWFVWLLVGAGAVLSSALREYVRYRTVREEKEKEITLKEREIAKKADSLVAWDELSLGNMIRMARGRKRYLALDDVSGILEDVVMRERPERIAIDKALNEVPLPTPLRLELRREFARLTYLSARDDARTIDRGIESLARQAQDGFQSALVGWIRKLEETHSKAKSKILDTIAEPSAPFDAESKRRVSAALDVLGWLIDDARTLAFQTNISQGQADVLAKVEPALSSIENWVNTGNIPDKIVSIIHCGFSDFDAAEEADTDVPTQLLTVRARANSGQLTANHEITFELVTKMDNLEEAEIYEPTQLPLEWRVDGQTVIRGGPRMTFVFANAGWLGTGTRTVEARLGGRRLGVWTGRIERPELTIAVFERFWSLLARSAASTVGVIVAGAAAVGLLWANKPFGGWADYVTAALTGLGVDVTVVTGGSRLLETVLGVFVGQRRDNQNQ
ncbi:MAG: hypothetical protein IPK82_17375 [Polyangiaceae bacterium]|nr:hypothetical protein [Polyangiaceae bacterium]